MNQLPSQLRQIARNIARRAAQTRGWWFWKKPANSNLNAYAVVIALAADRILELEQLMRTQNQAVTALLDDDDAKTARIGVLGKTVEDQATQITNLTKALEDATAAAQPISPENMARINAIVPDPNP